jgi:hypothetical protein
LYVFGEKGEDLPPHALRNFEDIQKAFNAAVKNVSAFK